MNKKDISSTELIEKLHTAFETVFFQNNIQFVLNPIAHNFMVSANGIQLSRAISNIIVNASKYTDANGKVTLGINQKCENIIISISDTGIGISEFDIAKVCNQFYQVRNHINDSGGNGIGLSLTKEIINLHDGKLTIESEIGIGITFKIRLPLKAIVPLKPVVSNEVTKSKKKAIPLFPIPKQIKLFLVVDDNLKMRQYITRILYKYGYTCLHAANGIDALNLIEENTIHFILMDYIMPKMDGFNFIKNLKKQKIDIPVLMLTARNDSRSRLTIFRLELMII